MSPQHWFKQLITRIQPARRHVHGKRARKDAAQLFVEALEDRSTPSATWTNATHDGKASTPGNWSENPVGNTIVFDGTSNTAITIDISVSVAAVQINAGYTSTITLQSGKSLTVTGSITQSSAATSDLSAGSSVSVGGNLTVSAGTLKAPGSTFTVGGDWTVANAATFDNNGGMVEFTKSSGTQTLDSGASDTSDASHDFHDLTHTGGASLQLGDPLLVTNNLSSSAGSFDLAGNDVLVQGSANFDDANINDTVGGAKLMGEQNIGLGTGTVNAVLADGPVAAGIHNPGASIYKNGSGTVTLTAANTLTGVTVITGGTLSISDDNNLGGTTKLGPNSIQFQGTTGILQTTGTPTINSSRGMVLVEDGHTTGSGTIDVSSGTLTYDGVIKDIYSGLATGNLIKIGAGTLSLGGSSTYSGTTSIKAGTLSAGNIVVSGGSSNLGNATSAVVLGGTSTTGTLSYTGGTASYIRGFTVNAGGGEIDVTTGGHVLTIGTGGISTAGTLTVGGAGDTTISSVIGSGAGGLTKTGTGTLTLSNNSNTYSGPTFVSQGTLADGIANALPVTTALTVNGTGTFDLASFAQQVGSLSDGSVSTGTVTDSAGAATFTDNDAGTHIFSGLITGSLAFTFSGSGRLTLSNASNSYSGQTKVLAGTLVVGADAPSGGDGALGHTTTAVLVGDTTGTKAASLLIGGAFTVYRDVTVQTGSSGAKTLGGSTANASVFDGLVTLNDPVTLTAEPSDTVTFSGKLTGSGGITKIGNGTVVLGNNTDDNAGTTTVTGGTLQLGASDVLPDTTGVTINGGATLDLASFSDTVNAVHLVLGNISDTVTGGTLTSTTTFDVRSGSVSAVLDGTAGLTKTTSNPVTLSAANLYSGTTTISDGTLLIGAANALPIGTTLNVNSTLDLNGNSQEVAQITSSLGTGTVTDNGAAATFTVNNAGLDSYNGTITGTNLSLSKSGGGTLTLTKANTYGGTTTISAGTVAAGHSNALPSTTSLAVDGTFDLNGFGQQVASVTSAGAGIVTNSGLAATFTINNAAPDSYAGTIAGNLTLAKSGVGLLTLTQTNSYTGATTISAGTLANGSGSANVLPTTTALTVSGTGTFDLAGFAQQVSSLSDGGVSTGIVTDSGLAATFTVNDAGPHTYSGTLAGTLALTKLGAGTLTLSNVANSYTGPTQISAGTLSVPKLANAGSNSSIGAGSTIQLGNGTAATLSYTGFSDSTDRGIAIMGTGGTIQNKGTGTLTFTGPIDNQGNPLTFDTNSSDITESAAGVIQSAGTLTKIGTGTLRLNGANTYGGATSINAGILQLGVTGSITSSVAVAATGTLTGTGTITGTVTVAAAGTVAPGIAGAGTLNVVGAATVPTSSTFQVRLDTTTSSQLSATGTVDITGSTLAGSLGVAPAIGTPVTIISSSTGVTGRFATLPNTGDTTIIDGVVFQIAYNASNVTLTRIGNPATHFGITTSSTAVAGNGFAVVVSPLDSDNNPTEGYIGTVTLTTTDAAGTVVPLNHTFTSADHGSFFFTVKMYTAGVQTLTVSGTGGLPSASRTVQVSDTGVAAQVLFRQNPTSAFISTAIKPAVTALIADQYGNAISSDNTDQIALSLLNNTTGATLAGTTTAKVTNGVATFSNLTVNKPGTYRLISASGVLPSGVSGVFNIYAATHFDVNLGQTTVVAGTPITTVTVTARQGAGLVGSAGAVDTTYNATIHFTSSDPNAVLPADTNAFVSGVATFSVANFNPVTLKKAGSQSVTVKEVARGITGTKSITVTPAAVAGFSFGALATTAVKVGTPQSFVLSAVDPYGNVNPAFTGLVTLAAGGVGTGTLSPTSHTYVTADKGVFTFSVNQLIAGAGLLTVTATSGSISTTQNVNRLAASITPTVAGTTAAVPGESISFTFGAVAGTVPTSTKFTYAINWGDGVVQTLTSQPSTLVVAHTYTKVLTPTISLTVTDPTLKTNATTLAFSVVPASLQPDPISIGQTALFVGGTNPATGVVGNDTITVLPSGANTNVSINGSAPFAFTTTSITGHIFVFGQGGNDNITVSTAIPAIVDGGAGNDVIDLSGNSANSILLGQDGNDILTGGTGRNILIGGLGTDSLTGGAGDDILIGGTTNFDTNQAALNAIMAEWASVNSYALRIGHIFGSIPGGLNGSTLLNMTTVKSDQFIDSLYGEAGQNWFWYTSAGTFVDLLQDLSAGQVATPLPK
ncbi:MAG TPA: autotransporter-associated beta strand repeat-containing protein [Gemmataceae bacterium]|nr:autotransporter-associated beta strand repeat-containing protein [Gemmataceae bacterium]